MQHPPKSRSLTDEELALMSSPVDKPTAQLDSFQQTGALRPVAEDSPRRRGGAFEAMWAVEDNLELSEDPVWRVGQSGVGDLGWFEPVARTIWNIPGGAIRGVQEIASAVSPYHLAKGFAIRAGEAAVAHQAAGDDDRLYRHFMDVQAEGRQDEGFTETQQVLGTLFSEVVGPFARGTFANPYDPRNQSLFDPDTTAERMPSLHAMGEVVESVLPASPWDPEYNPEWASNLSTMVQEESGELVAELLTGGALGSVGRLIPSGLTRTLGQVPRKIRGVVDDIKLEGVFDFDDVDHARRQVSAGIEIEQVRQSGTSRRTATGSLVQDPETGQRYLSTAAHAVVGQGGESIGDLAGFRLRSSEGDIGTVRGVVGLDLERDVALLEVAGLSDLETLGISDTPLSTDHTLLGRTGSTAQRRITDIESGRYLRTTTAEGVAGESGAGLISEGDQLGGLYLGRVGESSVYAPGEAVSELFGQAREGQRYTLGSELSQRFDAEALHYRYGRGELGVVSEKVGGLELHSDLAKRLDTDAPRLRYERQGGIGKRTYGLELEFLAETSRVDLQRELEPLGVDLVYDVSIKSSDPDVDVQYQGPSGLTRGSESDAPRRGRRTLFGHEAVFPIMEGAQDLEKISQATDIIARQPGLELNTSQASHVHVGALDLNSEQLTNLYSQFVNYEDVIDLLQGPDRRGEGGTYTKSPRSDLGDYGTLLERRERSENVGDLESLLDVVQGDRYRKFHIGGAGFRTVEYRQPGITVDAGEIERNIRFATGFVDRFKDVPFIPRPFALPQQLISELGIDAPRGQPKLSLQERRSLYGLEEKLWKSVSEGESFESQLEVFNQLRESQRSLIPSEFDFPGYRSSTDFSGSGVGVSEELTPDILKKSFGKEDVPVEPIHVSAPSGVSSQSSSVFPGLFGTLEDVRGVLEERGDLGGLLESFRENLMAVGHSAENIESLSDDLLMHEYSQGVFGDLGIEQPGPGIVQDVSVSSPISASSPSGLFEEFMAGVWLWS